MELTKVESQYVRQALSKAKDFENLKEFMGSRSGEEELRDIIKAIQENSPRKHRMIIEQDSPALIDVDTVEDLSLSTPEGTQNPEPPGSGAPFLPNDIERVAAIIPARDNTTPTPITAHPQTLTLA